MTRRDHAKCLIQLLSISLCLLFLIFSETAYSAALKSLILVGKTVLPVLLPFTVLSNLISDTLTAGNRMSAIVTAFFIGNICGAPIGAILTERLYENGIISKKEAGSLLPAVSCTSPAFCISAVGNCIFNNTNFGILIWSTQVIINLAILLFFQNKNKTEYIIEQSKFTIDPATAISKAANALCPVSASIVFFSVLSAVISDLCNLNPLFECALNSVLEMSGGCALAGYIDYPFSYLFASFTLGFGGVSILMQVSACTRGISKKNYILSKLITGIVCASVTLINSPFFASAIEKLTN